MWTPPPEFFRISIDIGPNPNPSCTNSATGRVDLGESGKKVCRSQNSASPNYHK